MNRKLIFLVALLGFIAVALALILIFVPAPKKAAPPVSTADWVPYRNDKYGFEIMHPSDWLVSVNEGPEPKINIYKEEGSKPPFTHNNNVTQVSVFPKGIGTEGADGQSVTSSVKFSEPVDQAVDFTLKNGDKWATYATFASRPEFWEPYGFLWAGVRVDGLSAECILNGKTLSMDKCDLGDRPEGSQIVLDGKASKEDRAVEERMLETFIFWKVNVSGEITCLPHKGNGPQTEECAIGLKADGGRYYGLLGLNQDDIVSGKWTTGVRARVSGTLSAAPESKYDIVGNITVQKIVPDAAS